MLGIQGHLGLGQGSCPGLNGAVSKVNGNSKGLAEVFATLLLLGAFAAGEGFLTFHIDLLSPTLLQR